MIIKLGLSPRQGIVEQWEKIAAAGPQMRSGVWSNIAVTVEILKFMFWVFVC